MGLTPGEQTNVLKVCDPVTLGTFLGSSSSSFRTYAMDFSRLPILTRELPLNSRVVALHDSAHVEWR